MLSPQIKALTDHLAKKFVEWKRAAQAELDQRIGAIEKHNDRRLDEIETAMLRAQRRHFAELKQQQIGKAVASAARRKAGAGQ